jgi:hypothetical protein
VHEHPDRQAAIDRATEMLEAAFGRDVKVRASSQGFRAELRFADLDEVRSFANR